MPVDHKRKLIFVHIPKNAGTSIEKHCEMDDTGHKNWKYYYSKYVTEWNEYTSFAVIRDPIDRFISCYRYARMKKVTGTMPLNQIKQFMEYILIIKSARG